MKVLQIDTEKTWRGGENQMRLLIEGLREYGINAHLALQPDGEAYKRLGSEYSTLGVKMSGGMDFGAVFKIVSYCRQHKIELIDAQTSNAHSLALLVKFFLPSMKLVVHRRVDFPLKKSWINQKKYKTLKIDQFVAISSAIGQIMTDYGIEKKRVRVIPSAVSPEPYKDLEHTKEKEELCQHLNIDPTLPLLGNASALTDQKGYEVLFEALAILRSQGERFHCVIAGDGHLRSKLERMRMELKIDDCVTFMGWIKNVPPFLKALDVLTMPSNYEGLGTLILDATYAGCPVIATSVGGIPEMITHKKSGLLSPVGDGKKLAENIQFALKHPELWAEYNGRAVKHIEQNFSLKNMVDGNLDVYRTLLKS